jgi:hypothetical protein
MIKLRDLLPEAVAHETTTLLQVWQGRIPIYPALMKKVIGDIPIESFHITDWYRAKGLGNLIGKKKSLSTFTALKRNSMQTTGGGIQTNGGIVFHLEGKLLAAGLSDIGSVPDMSGRRWFHPETLGEIVGWKFGQNDVHDFVAKNKKWDALRIKYIENYKDPSDKNPPLTNKEKQQYIKGWIDGCEKFLLKHKNIIKKKFIEATTGRVPAKSIYGWNELVIYDIEAKGALIVLDGLAAPGEFEELDKNLKHTEKIVKKYTKNIQRGFMSDDVVRKYILKHGGKIGSLDPKQIKIRIS